MYRRGYSSSHTYCIAAMQDRDVRAGEHTIQ